MKFVRSSGTWLLITCAAAAAASPLEVAAIDGVVVVVLLQLGVQVLKCQPRPATLRCLSTVSTTSLPKRKPYLPREFSSSLLSFLIKPPFVSPDHAPTILKLRNLYEGDEI